MRLLLDTHVLLWAHASPERLGRSADLLLDPANELFVSAMSACEIAVEVGIGRLVLPEDAATWVPNRTKALGAVSMPITQTHAVGVADLPHCDTGACSIDLSCSRLRECAPPRRSYRSQSRSSRSRRVAFPVPTVRRGDGRPRPTS